MIPLGVLGSARVAAAGGGGTLAFLHAAAINTKTEGVWRFLNVPLGDAASDRYVVAHVSARDGSKTSAVTIGGVSATMLVEEVSQTNYGSIWAAVVPSGTSGIVNVTQSGTVRCHIGVHTLTGFGTISKIATGSGTSSAAGLQPSGATLAGMNTGDIIIAGSEHLAYNNQSRCTWTNADEEYDGIYGSDGQLISSGGSVITAASSLTISAAWDNPRLTGPTIAVALRGSA